MNKKPKIIEAYIKTSTPQEIMYDVIEKMQEMKHDFGEMHAHIERDVRDEEQIKKVIKPLIPKVRDGKDAHTPTVEELMELIVPLVPKVENGKDGQDGSPDSPEEIRDKIKSLKGKERLSVFDLKDTEWLRGNGKGKDTVQWNAVGGLSKVTTDATLTGDGTASNPLSVVQSGSQFTELPATGVVNGSNQTFTFTKVPTYLVVDGVWYKKNDNNGTVQWSSSGLTITTNITPQNAIWGFK